MATKIKKSEIDVHKSPNGRYFLEINNSTYDVFRTFESLPQLITHLRQYPIVNKEKIIKEIKTLDRL